MNKIDFQKIKNVILSKKKIIIPILVVIMVILFFVFRSQKKDMINVGVVEYADLTRSVRATGQVISNTDLNLSFNKSSVVKSVKVKVGDNVVPRQILATLEQGQALATLTQAKGALLGAQARYKKTLEGASNEEIALAQVALKSAETDLVNIKNNQATQVANTFQTLLNSSIAVFPTFSTIGTQTPPTLSGTYVLGKEGEIVISASTLGGANFTTSGIIQYKGNISTTTLEPIGDSGLFIKFPVDYAYPYDWVISIPNKKAPNYLANYNAYKSALENEKNAVATAQSLVYQKQAELNLKKAVARNTDIDIAHAEVISAEGSLQSASSSYEDTVIRAPAPGTITKVDIKYGEISEAGKSVITLEDVNNLYIEALINEANIAYLKIGQSVGITFDAFGDDKKFTGSIAHIDPSAETNDGVVNYKIKVSIVEKNEIIRPGMNANIDVLAGEAKNVLAIPNVAVTKKDGKSFVNVVTDEKNKKYEERPVVTGFIGDNNLVEIVSGLHENEKIALIQN